MVIQGPIVVVVVVVAFNEQYWQIVLFRLMHLKHAS